MKNFFEDNDSVSAIEAQYNAQKIAFAPIIFQVARSMRDLGVLQALYEHKEGLAIEDIAAIVRLSKYSVTTLIETSLSIDIVKQAKDRYFLTKTGFFLLNDKMTNVNMNYNHYVNYKGLYDLDIALREQKAVGLKEFSDKETIYPVLASLPQKVKESWFNFDHFYSDGAFDEALEIVKKLQPKKVLDIGGNTGKFATALAKSDETIQITIMDLSPQLELAKKTIQENGITNQVDFIDADILDENSKIPKEFDVIWMSQFLDCFSQEQIIGILKKAKDALSDGTVLCIMEPFWDRQNFEASAFCIINTSPYFTAMANGYSKMYHSAEFMGFIKEAELNVMETIDNIGLCQSIIIVNKRS